MAPLRRAVDIANALYGQRFLTAYNGYVRHDPLAQAQLRRGRRDPYPFYEQVRAAGPIVQVAEAKWATTSYELCSSVLRDRRMGASPEGWTPGPDGGGLAFLDVNPPEHTRLRRLISPAFSPRQLDTYEPRVQKSVDTLLDTAGQEFDLVSAFATLLPMTVISDLLGVPADRRDAFSLHGTVIGHALDGVRGVRHARALRRANASFRVLFDELFALRRREPQDDVISLIVAAEGDQVRPHEMVPLCVLLLIAGFETTTNLISNAVLALMAHREQWEALCANPTLAADVVEETLRWDTPVQQTLRFALADLDVGGVPIPKGGSVLTLIAAANRDPAIYAQPDRFDIGRDPKPDHLAFAAGIHYCIGQGLARIEATAAIRALAERHPNLRIRGRVVRRRSSTLRGPLHLPVHS